MTTTIAIACLTALALGTARTASASVSGRTRPRDVTRRLRHLTQHPRQVGSSDIERLLLADDVPAVEARLVVEKAATHGINPFTMLMWIQQYDARSLSVVVAADLGHQELLLHLAGDTVPDLGELGLFASLNGLSVTARATRTPVGATVVRREDWHRAELRRDSRAA